MTTAPHAPKEYTITEDDIETICMAFPKSFGKHLRSHPFPAPEARGLPPAPKYDINQIMEIDKRIQKEKKDSWEQGYQDGASAVQHDLNLIKDESARQAREDLLNELESLIQDKWEFMFGVLPYNTEVSKDSLYKMINSLRQAQPRERE